MDVVNNNEIIFASSSIFLQRETDLYILKYENT